MHETAHLRLNLVNPMRKYATHAEASLRFTAEIIAAVKSWHLYKIVLIMCQFDVMEQNLSDAQICAFIETLLVDKIATIIKKPVFTIPSEAKFVFTIEHMQAILIALGTHTGRKNVVEVVQSGRKPYVNMSREHRRVSGIVDANIIRPNVVASTTYAESIDPEKTLPYIFVMRDAYAHYFMLTGKLPCKVEDLSQRVWQQIYAILADRGEFTTIKIALIGTPEPDDEYKKFDPNNAVQNMLCAISALKETGHGLSGGVSLIQKHRSYTESVNFLHNLFMLLTVELGDARKLRRKMGESVPSTPVAYDKLLDMEANFVSSYTPCGFVTLTRESPALGPKDSGELTVKPRFDQWKTNEQAENEMTEYLATEVRPISYKWKDCTHEMERHQDNPELNTPELALIDAVINSGSWTKVTSNYLLIDGSIAPVAIDAECENMSVLDALVHRRKKISTNQTIDLKYSNDPVPRNTKRLRSKNKSSSGDEEMDEDGNFFFVIFPHC